MPTRLSAELVADALTRLTGWEGGSDRISRTVVLTDDQDRQVRELLAVTTAAMNHDPEVERDGDKTTYTCWTHSESGVTELDIALASRINSHLRRATGEEPPPLPAEALGAIVNREDADMAETRTGTAAPGGGRHRAPEPAYQEPPEETAEAEDILETEQAARADKRGPTPPSDPFR
jgi:4a-hydroxytetrahydrobiopterin dehydratase